MESKQAQGHWQGTSSTCTSVSSAVSKSLENPSGITPQPQACAGAASPPQNPAGLGTKPPSRAARYHFSNGLSFACISAAGTRPPLLSGTLSKVRGIAGENVPHIFSFNFRQRGEAYQRVADVLRPKRSLRRDYSRLYLGMRNLIHAQMCKGEWY